MNIVQNRKPRTRSLFLQGTHPADPGSVIPMAFNFPLWITWLISQLVILRYKLWRDLQWLSLSANTEKFLVLIILLRNSSAGLQKLNLLLFDPPSLKKQKVTSLRRNNRFKIILKLTYFVDVATILRYSTGKPLYKRTSHRTRVNKQRKIANLLWNLEIQSIWFPLPIGKFKWIHI